MKRCVCAYVYIDWVKNAIIRCDRVHKHRHTPNNLSNILDYYFKFIRIAALFPFYLISMTVHEFYFDCVMYDSCVVCTMYIHIDSSIPIEMTWRLSSLLSLFRIYSICWKGKVRCIAFRFIKSIIKISNVSIARKCRNNINYPFGLNSYHW